MFWVLVLLLFLGMVLIFLEVIVPHGLSVMAGLAVIAISCYLCFTTFGLGRGVIYVIVTSLLAGGAAFYVFRSSLRWLALAPPRRDAAPGPGPAAAEEMPRVGDRVKVIQPLRPTGSVEWKGRRFPARSLRPEIETRVGSEAELREMDSIYLLVEPVEEASKNIAPAGDSWLTR